jgi:glycosyltransferase involved in cell wall biosynthesis
MSMTNPLSKAAVGISMHNGLELTRRCLSALDPQKLTRFETLLADVRLASSTARRARLALVCWSGSAGGAEFFSADLAVALRANGVDPGVVIVGADGPVSDRLDVVGIPRSTLRLRRGSQVLLHPRQLAKAVTAAGEDGAILQSDGYLAAALRVGGYAGPIVAVQHGAVLLRASLPLWRRLLREVDQLSGIGAIDALVAVSHHALRTASRHPHPRRMLTIHNGVDVHRFRPSDRRARSAGLTVGFAGRLIRGKGADVLLHALAAIGDLSVQTEIAGDGPERSSLESLARRLGIAAHVRFRGFVDDMPAFWRACDVAVVASHTESFGLVAIEAMASGLPVVATANGALPEIVTHGRTGTIVPVDDPVSLAKALEAYATDPGLRDEQGRRGRADCELRFGINRCARAYMKVFGSLSACPEGVDR